MVLTIQVLSPKPIIHAGQTQKHRIDFFGSTCEIERKMTYNKYVVIGGTTWQTVNEIR